VGDIARRDKLSVEVAARQQRHAFFRRECARLGCTALCTAHHADDQAETVLLRLLRGAGPTGLAAMDARGEGGIVRPLLGVTRAQIMDYCGQNALQWREDASNACLDIPRNRVRHELLPYLREHFNPGITQTLSRTAALARLDDSYMDTLAQEAWANARTPGGGLGLAALCALPEALARRVVRKAARAAGITQDMEAVHVEALLRMARTGTTGDTLNLPAGLCAARDADALVIYRPQQAQAYCVQIALGRNVCPAGVLAVAEVPRPAVLKTDDPYVQYADAEALAQAVLRTRRGGERMQPYGAPGSKKLKDIFIDKKVPARLRAQLPLLCRGDEVLWAVGVALGQAAAITPGTQKVLRLQFVPYHSEGE